MEFSWKFFLLANLLTIACSADCPESGTSITFEADCKGANVFGLNITCATHGPYVIWNGQIFSREVTISTNPAPHHVSLNIEGVSVATTQKINNSCFYSTLTFTGSNLAALANEFIECKLYETAVSKIILPLNIRMVYETAVCASFDCIEKEGSTVYLELTAIAGGIQPLQYQVNVTDKLECLIENVSTPLNGTLLLSCNSTYLVSTSSVNCNYVQPSYSMIPAIQQVNFGSSFLLKLNLETRPPVLNYTWTRNGIPLLQNVTATSIYISKTSLIDGGTYTVMAQNNFNSTTASFNLSILCPIQFQIHPPSRAIIIYEGDMLLITCNITKSSCSLPTNITLTVIGQNNPLNGKIYDITLDRRITFDNVNQNLSGSYICRAKNDRNVTTLTYQVDITANLIMSTTTEALPTLTPTNSSSGDESILSSIDVIITVCVSVCIVSLTSQILICTLCCYINKQDKAKYKAASFQMKDKALSEENLEGYVIL